MRVFIRALTVIVVVLVFLCTAGAVYLFTDVFDPLFPKGETSGVLRHEGTNEQTAYYLEILRYDEIESGYARSWIDSRKDRGSVNERAVYHTLYNDDFELPMEMYLFMPLAQEIMGDITLSNVRVYESGNALVLNIDTKDNIRRTKDGTDLVLHIFADGSQDNADARTERLYINGSQYYCPGATFTKIR